MRSGLGHYERGQRAATQPFKNHWCPLSSPCPSRGVTDESQIPLMCSLTNVPCQRKFPSCWWSARLPPRSLSDISLSSEASAFIERVSNSVSHAVLLNERQSRQPFLFQRTLSLQGDPVDGIGLNVLVELLATHKLLHTSLAQSVGIQYLEKFLELI